MKHSNKEGSRVNAAGSMGGGRGTSLAGLEIQRALSYLQRFEETRSLVEMLSEKCELCGHTSTSCEKKKKKNRNRRTQQQHALRMFVRLIYPRQNRDTRGALVGGYMHTVVAMISTWSTFDGVATQWGTHQPPAKQGANDTVTQRSRRSRPRASKLHKKSSKSLHNKHEKTPEKSRSAETKTTPPPKNRQYFGSSVRVTTSGAGGSGRENDFMLAHAQVGAHRRRCAILKSDATGWISREAERTTDNGVLAARQGILARFKKRSKAADLPWSRDGRAAGARARCTTAGKRAH